MPALCTEVDPCRFRGRLTWWLHFKFLTLDNFLPSPWFGVHREDIHFWFLESNPLPELSKLATVSRERDVEAGRESNDSVPF